ncbi:UNVERIFIED_CONTAM: hypothetical protein HHA_262170 [Hammondia hammondi]|eukprot:XP_008882880.1 hypothetical protein HHA_262170 [Hammondia hammondi]
MPPSAGRCRQLLRQCWTQELKKRDRIQPLSPAARRQAKKDPKLLTPSLTRHMQLRDLPTGFTSRFVQDKRRMKVASASDVDVAEFSLPPTAQPRKDPLAQLTPLDLLAIHPSPSVTARARDAAAASFLRRHRSTCSGLPRSASPADSPRHLVSTSSIGGLRGASAAGQDTGRWGLLSRQAVLTRTGTADDGTNRGRGRPVNSADSRNTTDLGGREVDATRGHPFPRLAETPDLYVELSRIAAETGFTLDVENALAVVSRKRSPKAVGSAAASNPAFLPQATPVFEAGSRRPRRDTSTLRRVVPAAERHRQRSGGRTYGGGWGWKDDREAVKDVYRHHVTVERSSSASPFAFSVVPED